VLARDHARLGAIVLLGESEAWRLLDADDASERQNVDLIAEAPKGFGTIEPARDLLREGEKWGFTRPAVAHDENVDTRRQRGDLRARSQELHLAPCRATP
jgi:hypothetical protein